MISVARSSVFSILWPFSNKASVDIAESQPMLYWKWPWNWRTEDRATRIKTWTHFSWFRESKIYDGYHQNRTVIPAHFELAAFYLLSIPVLKKPAWDFIFWQFLKIQDILKYTFGAICWHTDSQLWTRFLKNSVVIRLFSDNLIRILSRILFRLSKCDR